MRCRRCAEARGWRSRFGLLQDWRRKSRWSAPRAIRSRPPPSNGALPAPPPTARSHLWVRRLLSPRLLPVVFRARANYLDKRLRHEACTSASTSLIISTAPSLPVSVAHSGMAIAQFCFLRRQDRMAAWWYGSTVPIGWFALAATA